MTPDDLRLLLRRLADLTGTLLDDLDDSALPAASYSGNEGAAPKGGKSKPPVPIADLDYIVTDVEPRIRGWCQNLAATAHLTGYPAGARVNILVAWLSRHRETLLTQDWAQDCTDELADLTAELAARLHPAQPDRPLLPDFATADEIAKATGRTPAGVQKWCQRNHVESWTVAGVKQYKTSQVKYKNRKVSG